MRHPLNLKIFITTTLGKEQLKLFGLMKRRNICDITLLNFYVKMNLVPLEWISTIRSPIGILIVILNGESSIHRLSIKYMK